MARTGILTELGSPKQLEKGKKSLSNSSVLRNVISSLIKFMFGMIIKGKVKQTKRVSM